MAMKTEAAATLPAGHFDLELSETQNLYRVELYESARRLRELQNRRRQSSRDVFNLETLYLENPTFVSNIVVGYDASKMMNKAQKLHENEHATTPASGGTTCSYSQHVQPDENAHHATGRQTGAIQFVNVFGQTKKIAEPARNSRLFANSANVTTIENTDRLFSATDGHSFPRQLRKWKTNVNMHRRGTLVRNICSALELESAAGVLPQKFWADGVDENRFAELDYTTTTKTKSRKRKAALKTTAIVGVRREKNKRALRQINIDKSDPPQVATKTNKRKLSFLHFTADAQFTYPFAVDQPPPRAAATRSSVEKDTVSVAVDAALASKKRKKIKKKIIDTTSEDDVECDEKCSAVIIPVAERKSKIKAGLREKLLKPKISKKLASSTAVGLSCMPRACKRTPSSENSVKRKGLDSIPVEALFKSIRPVIADNIMPVESDTFPITTNADAKHQKFISPKISHHIVNKKNEVGIDSVFGENSVPRKITFSPAVVKLEHATRTRSNTSRKKNTAALEAARSKVVFVNNNNPPDLPFVPLGRTNGNTPRVSTRRNCSAAVAQNSCLAALLTSADNNAAECAAERVVACEKKLNNIEQMGAVLAPPASLRSFNNSMRQQQQCLPIGPHILSSQQRLKNNNPFCVDM